MKRDWLVKAFTTALFVGYFPLAPGTMGTLMGMLVFLGVGKYIWLHAAVVVLLFFLGVRASALAEEIFQAKDSPRIVIDEVVGYLVAMFGFSRHDWQILVLGFVLNRVFDISKPFPLRKLEYFPRGWGVMLDDVGAGIYANVALRLILFIF